MFVCIFHKMFVLVVLSVVAVVRAADPSDRSTFHDTGHLLWKDCGGSNAWLTLTTFDMTPTPVAIPGESRLTLHGTNGHTEIHQNVEMNVTVLKELVGRWTPAPCTRTGNDQALGSCFYNEPCRFMQSLFADGHCPEQFARYGLGCTCPFTIAANETLDINDDPVTIPAPDPRYDWLATGSYYLKIVMREIGSAVERMCLEFYINVHK